MTDYEQQANQLKIMGHPVRLHILNLLRQGEISVCHIEKALNRRQAYISQQLKTLRDAGLVETRKDGVLVFYRIIDQKTVAFLHFLYGETDPNIEILRGCSCPVCSTIPQMSDMR